MTTSRQTPKTLKASDFDALLKVARSNRVMAFEVGDVKVTFEPVTFALPVDDGKPKTKAQLAAEQAAEDEILFHSSAP